jgi:hypothetical protein
MIYGRESAATNLTFAYIDRSSLGHSHTRLPPPPGAGNARVYLYLSSGGALLVSFIGNFVASFLGNRGARIAAHSLIGFIPLYIVLLFFSRSYAEDRQFLATFRPEPWPWTWLEYFDRAILSPVLCATVSILGAVLNTMLLIVLDPNLLRHLGFSAGLIAHVL